MTRKPYVAGSFYPARKDELLHTIEDLVEAGPARGKAPAVAVVAPHAGYMYSGPVAGAVFSSVEIPAVCLIIGPAHREIAPLFAVQTEGSWLIPLGEVPIATPLAELVMARCRGVENDEAAHRSEHSLEVQVPFLRYFRPDVAIVPVCVSHEAGYDDLEAFGKGAAAAVRSFGGPVLIVASTDMSHYVSQAAAERLDRLAIGRILDLDPRGLFDTVRDRRITMCGYQPVTAALVASRELGAAKADLVKYETSGERTGDFSQVVGYAGLTISTRLAS